MAIVTNMATAFKQELFSGGHCFNATVSPTASVSSGSVNVTAVSSMSGVAVGMTVTAAAGIAGGTVVASITGTNTMTLSQAATGTISGTAISVAGDVFKMALIKPSMAGTYGTASVNYTNIVQNADEVTNSAGTSYTATGQILTNVTATTNAGVAFINFSPNPTWANATFSTAGCMIYNSSVRNGGVSGTNSTGGGRCCSVHDFGGSQQVSAGTFTVLMPSADSANAILRLA